MKRFYSVSEVAARFEVTSQTVRNWIAAGQLLSVQPTPGGRYKIRAQALLAFEQISGLLPKDAAMDPGDGPPMKAMASTLLGEPIASELTRVVHAIVTSVQPEGVILFGSRDPIWREKEFSSMGPQQLSAEEVRRRAVGTWLTDAYADLANARSLAAHRDEGTAPFASAFHAEQAVEKGVKALLVWHAVDFPPRHDLGLLTGLVPAGASMKELNVGGLTVYAVEQRYVAGTSNPMNLIERPTWDEAEEAIKEATDALSRVSADLAAAGWAASG